MRGAGSARARGDGAETATGRPGPELRISGWIDYVAWLCEEIAVLVGWFPLRDEEASELVLLREGHAERLDARIFSYERPDIPGDDSRSGRVVTARLDRPAGLSTPLGQLTVRTDGESLTLGPLELRHAATDLRSLALGGLLSIDQETRLALLSFLAAAPAEHGVVGEGHGASRGLASVNALLRPRRPRCAISRDRPQGLAVDELLRVDDRIYFVRGWARDAEGEIEDIALVSPEGARVPLLERAFRHARADVERFYGGAPVSGPGPKAGFLCCFETGVPSAAPDGWRAEMRNVEGTIVEATVPPVLTEPRAVRDAILAKAAGAAWPEEALLRDHLHPAIGRLQRRLLEEATVASVADYGELPPSPDVSIVVPLYRRLDFLEYQLALFVHDPGLDRAELIYVLDSPEQEDELTRRAAQLHELYRVPFRIASLRRNVGFSGANNAGASLARGRLLLLLNSDVLPAGPGWIGEMVAFHDATPEIGAVAPKLLFEDGSLQHAGLYFRRSPGSSVWENAHYFKGLQGELPEANVRRRVPAVTAACLLIDRSLYDEVGGLRGRFVQGDYEDSDLCLRLREAGRQIWYLPEVSLYHLEGQSYPSDLRRLTSRYNAWLHTRLWGETLQELMREDGSAVAATSSAPSPRPSPATRREPGREKAPWPS